MAPVLIGGALAHADGVFALLPFMAALFGGMLIQIGTNIANDYFDFVKGADTTQRLGGRSKIFARPSSGNTVSSSKEGSNASFKLG